MTSPAPQSIPIDATDVISVIQDIDREQGTRYVAEAIARVQQAKAMQMLADAGLLEEPAPEEPKPAE